MCKVKKSFILCGALMLSPMALADNSWLPITVYNLIDEDDKAPDTFPVADTIMTNWSTAVSIDVLANDPLNASYIPQLTKFPQFGTVQVINGHIQYTPQAEYIGDDSFDYKIVSNDGSQVYSAIAQVSITVTDIERGLAPVANGDVLVTTGENKTYFIDVVANDTDADSTILTVKSVNSAINGTVNLKTSSTIEYTPTVDYCGDDSITYVVQDEFYNEAQATITISCDDSYVVPLSTPKILASVIEVNASIDVNQSIFDVATEEYASDSKYANSQLKLVLDIPRVDKLTEEVLSVPSGLEDILGLRQNIWTTDRVGKAAVINFLHGAGVNPDKFKGQILYADNNVTDGTGIIEEIHYKLVNPDGQLSDEWGLLRISLDGSFNQNYNYTPTADQASTMQGQAVDIDVLDNDPQTQVYYQVEKYTYPANGKLTISDNKMSFNYLPNEGFSGIDTFKYKVISQFGDIDSAPAKVTINVGAQNQAPVAVDDLMEISDHINGATFDIIANDTDAENDFLSLLSVSNASFGSVIKHSNRTAKYVPNNGVCKADSFTYVVAQEPQGTVTDTGTVTVKCLDPTMPVAFSVPANTLPNGIVDITWQAPLKTGVTQYEVLGELKGTLAKRAFTADANGVYKFSRPAEVAGREYCYKVRALFNDGSIGTESETLCTLVSSNGQPVYEAPTNLSISQTANQQFLINWQPVAGAYKYLLELQTSASTTSDLGSQWQAVYYGAANENAVQYSSFHQAIFTELGRLTYRLSACNAQGVCGNYAREPFTSFTQASFLSSVPSAHKVPACIDVPETVSPNEAITVNFCPTQTNNVQSYELLGELAGIIAEGSLSTFSKTAQGLYSAIRPSLPEGRKYCFKLDARYPDGGRSDYTEKLCVIVGTLVFEKPAEFLALPSEVEFNSFRLIWTPISNAHHYLLEKEAQYGTWQEDNCEIATYEYNNKSYSSCIVNVTAADVVPEIGRVVYRVSACNAANVCGNYERRNFALMTVSSNVYINSEGKLYFQLSNNQNGRFVELAKNAQGKWVVKILTQEQWDALSPATNFTLSNYTLEFGEFSGDSLEDFKLINGGEVVVIVQTEAGVYTPALGKKILFIHTDILGTPVTETNINGNVN